MSNKCVTCKHVNVSVADEPCIRCFGVGSNYVRMSEPKEEQVESTNKICGNCKSWTTDVNAFPCNDCKQGAMGVLIDRWEANTPVKLTPEQKKAIKETKEYFTIGSKEGPKNDILEGKSDLSYLPMDLLEKVADAYAFGGKKGYPRNSWRQGFSISRLVAASRRHDTDFWDKGETFDKQAKEEFDTEVYHCAMVIFNQLCILDTLINHPELDDRRIKPNEETHNGSN